MHRRSTQRACGCRILGADYKPHPELINLFFTVKEKCFFFFFVSCELCNPTLDNMKPIEELHRKK